MRRLMTLISAGRNRTIVIRPELPRTRDAGWAVKPYRLKIGGFSWACGLVLSSALSSPGRVASSRIDPGRGWIGPGNFQLRFN
jgi:hypothetical protein